MPQPVHYSHFINFDFRRDAVLQRPNLAAYIAAISMHWNEIETRVAVFLAALLQGEANTVISVFLALQSDGAKRATIDTVTSLKLPTDELAKFQEIQRIIGRRYSERNTVIHGAWGISPEYPNDLLWSDLRETIAMFPDLMGLTDPSKTAERRTRILEQQKKIQVYTQRDFELILERMSTAYSMLEAFSAPYIQPVFEKLKL